MNHSTARSLTLLGISLAAAISVSAANPIAPEERLVESRGSIGPDIGTIELTDLEEQTASFNISPLDERTKQAILHAKALHVIAWQLHSGHVSSSDADGWFYEPVLIWADEKLVADLSLCALHQTRMCRTTIVGSHADLWPYGDAMYRAAQQSFPHGLPFVVLGTLFPQWEQVRAYSCPACVSARHEWERNSTPPSKNPLDPPQTSSAPQPQKVMRPTSIPNTVDYVESPSRDLPKTKAFFTALLGWHFTEYGPEYLDYTDGRTTGGFYRSEKVSSYTAGSTIAVIYTEHLEALRDQAAKLGATITRDIFAFPGGRRFHFTEPGGSEFAAWSDK